MVVALGPGKFYGSSLPRPRIYTDVRFNDYRVDPPVPVTDPLMTWAEEAHWSMGGLSFQRHRLQGRIEGSVEKLRAEQEKLIRKAQKAAYPKKKIGASTSPSTPAAPVAVKRKRRILALLDEEEEEEEEERMVEKKEVVRKTARKLGDDFDRVANEKRRSPGRRSGVGTAVLAAVRKQSPRTEEEEEEIMGSIGTKEKSNSIDKKVSGKKRLTKKGETAVKGMRSSPRLAMSQ
ncbi:OLC1v1023964C1 [Oldenlandia corymbosa var. corymbosa]|uniref:OLC1v1023964C1 n=1 Tax=Oldenlandia corymbosa var. corymbosa TaxID=529605 RepID=A0AAV1C482_OLDCO|nr:OLC1v1023964C1 [Oldenlandia corymbosa var. corymbosa]